MSKEGELAICQTFFKDCYTVCGEIVDITFLSERQTLLPVVIACVELSLDDPLRLNTMLRYQINISHTALARLEVTQVEILDLEKLLATIEHFGGDQVLTDCYTLAKSTLHWPTFELEPLCKALHDKLAQHEDGTPIKVKRDLRWLESKISHKDWVKPPSIIKETSMTEIDVASLYPTLDQQGKRFIDELTVVAVSDHLTKHPDLSLDSITGSSDLSLVVTDNIFQAAILAHPPFVTAIAKHFKCQSYQLKFDPAIYGMRDLLFKCAAPRSYGEISSTWYIEAAKLSGKLSFEGSLVSLLCTTIKQGKIDFAAAVEKLLQIDTASITALCQLNTAGDEVNCAPVISKARISAQMKKALNELLIGQESAVESLCEGYLTSSIRKQQGPRAIYTFVGPSGVGKTYLASLLLEQLEQYEQTGYTFSLFNMELYSGERDGARLFGSGSQYSDANLGELTRVVRAKPRQILLFDEIEKAHPSVIQSLLSVLDSGLAKDQTSQEEVDFSQCIVIFTSNLGQEALEQNVQEQSISVFELLKNSPAPISNNKLSPEFVNRLAKGYPVIFQKLKINHLVKLTEMELAQHTQLEQQLSFQWSDHFASFLLQTMAPDLSIRRLKNQTSKLQAQLLSTVSSKLHLIDTLPIKLNVSAAFSVPETPVKLLLLDNDERVINQLAKAKQNDLVSLCSDITQLTALLEDQMPNALLIDLDMLDILQLSVDDLLALYVSSKSIAIFTYRLTEISSRADSSVSQAIREHFDLACSNDADFPSHFEALLARVKYYLATESLLTQMCSRREAIEYHCSVTSDQGTLTADYRVTKRKQMVASGDILANEQFKMALPKVQFDQVIGLERAKKRLVEVVQWIKSPEKLSHLGVSVPSGFLFAGPSGTGKTFLAQAVAGECGLPFFAVSASELSSSIVGGTTENIKKLFATARKYAPSIVFIDEIDAIAAARSGNGQGTGGNNHLAVNTLLTEMDGFISKGDSVFVLAATNHPQLLDNAILRPGRFDETIYCDLPNRRAREMFFQRFDERHKLGFESPMLTELVSASRGMSSAELEQVFREAIYQSVGSQKRITIELIKQTMIRVTYGSPSESIVLSEQEKLRTAYHEAGHLLISALLFPNQEIQFVTIEPRNQALGFVATREEEEYESYSRQRIGHRLEVLLAGRAAELLLADNPDDISTGASNDIYKATSLAMHAIYEGGLEPSIGPINVPMITKFEESELVIQAQHAVQKWIMDAEASVIQRLVQHRKALDAIANTLHERESLLAEEIKALLHSHF